MRRSTLKKRIVVIKMGTKTLVSPMGKIKLGVVQSLADQIAWLYAQNFAPVLVSSGAVACGNNSAASKSLVEQQVAAMVGQPILMLKWGNAFAQHGLVVGQVVGMRSDFTRKETVEALHLALRQGIIPVINENDPVATEGLKAMREHGDNDMLSAIVANCVSASHLIILSDIDGLFSGGSPKDNGSTLVPVVTCITDEIFSLVRTSESDRPTGMGCKLEAIKFATSKGIQCHLANGNRPDVIIDLFGQNPPGTIFQAQ